MFVDRQDAANRLADRLKAYQGRNPLVLAIPRGAVPMAKVIADRLGGDFDVVLVRKLRSPFQSELAVGSVNESGWTYIAPFAASYGADAAYLEAEKRTQMETIRVRRARYSPIHAPIDPAGRRPSAQRVRPPRDREKGRRPLSAPAHGAARCPPSPPARG